MLQEDDKQINETVRRLLCGGSFHVPHATPSRSASGIASPFYIEKKSFRDAKVQKLCFIANKETRGYHIYVYVNTLRLSSWNSREYIV